MPTVEEELGAPTAGQLSPDELAELLGDDKKSDARGVCEDPEASL